jgi:hypothetical protein
MRGGHGGVEDRAQERASVGHCFTRSGFTGFEMETCDAVIHPFSAKENPRGDTGER